MLLVYQMEAGASSITKKRERERGGHMASSQEGLADTTLLGMFCKDRCTWKAWATHHGNIQGLRKAAQWLLFILSFCLS